jgi:hypothetical protein
MIYLSMEGKPVSSMYPWPPKHSKPYKGKENLSTVFSKPEVQKILPVQQ